jgi:hypothetical protein
MMAEAQGTPYRFYATMEEARSDPEAVAVLEGDEGGTIFAVIPVGMVRCSTEVLERLLSDLDSIIWPHNELDMRRLVFEHAPAGTGIPGGMGGGASTGDIWVHPTFDAALVDEVREIVAGERERIQPRQPH